MTNDTHFALADSYETRVRECWDYRTDDARLRHHFAVDWKTRQEIEKDSPELLTKIND